MSLVSSNEKRQAYYCSREWGLKKEAVRQRSGGICERCQKNQAYAVHHKTYIRLYNERLEDLVHLCDGCHEYIHGKTNNDPAEEFFEQNLVFQSKPPTGIYNIQIVESEIELGLDESKLLKLTMEILEGKFQKFRLNEKLIILSRNLNAQRFGQRFLGNLCAQINIFSLTDSSQLHFKPFKVRIINNQDKIKIICGPLTNIENRG